MRRDGEGFDCVDGAKFWNAAKKSRSALPTAENKVEKTLARVVTDEIVGSNSDARSCSRSCHNLIKECQLKKPSKLPFVLPGLVRMYSILQQP